MAIDKEKTLQAAQRAVEKKKYDVAIEEYRKLAAAEKNDPRWLLKIGDLMQKKGDLGAAIATYDEVAKFYAGQGFHLKAMAVYNTMRDLLSRQPPQVQGRYQHVAVKLAEIYERLQLTSDAVATWDQIAERLVRDGREVDAIEVYRRIVLIDGSNPITHLRLAEALSRQKDTEGAIVEFAATAEQLTAQKRIDDALKVYERLLHHKPDPKYAKAAAELYLTRNGASDGVAAIAKIQICLKSDPKAVDLIALLARAFVAIGQTEKALTIYKESARLAGEQGKQELRADIIRSLHALAPGDDLVRQLVAEMQGGGKVADAQAKNAADAQARVQAETRRAEEVRAKAEADARKLEAAQQAAVRAVRPTHQAPTTMNLDDAIVEINEEDADDDDSVDVEEREAAEELSDFESPSQKSRTSRIAEVVANADAFRRVKLYAKALTTLRIGLELDPRSIPIRERIRDILIESGQTDYAIGEMLSLASILLEDSDLRGAYDNLAWILDADPEHPEANRLMHEVQVAAGNVPAGEPEVAVGAETEHEPEQHPESHNRHAAFEELDEPEIPEELPRFADELDEPPGYDVASNYEEVYVPTGADTDQSFEDLPEPDLVPDRTHSVPYQHIAEAAPPSEERPVESISFGAAEVEAALEEADFYATQGVFETARETVEEALKAAPNNRLLREKLREIEGLMSSHPSRELPPSSGFLDDRAFDLAASLDALDDLAPPAKAQPTEQVDVEEVFAKFKLGVAAQVDAADSATHYDLGIAYDQMMLYDDAIGEFQIAARNPELAALCHSMIGVIYEKKSQYAEAVEAYKLGLHSDRLTRDQEFALLYSLADVWGKRQNRREAIYYLKRIVSVDANYRDSRSKLEKLEREEAGMGRAEKGSGARPKEAIDDELDAAFDDVLMGGDTKKRRA